MSNEPKFNSELERLRAGLIFFAQKKELEEPQNTVIGRVSNNTRHLQRRWQYAAEVDRILFELKLTLELVNGISVEKITTESRFRTDKVLIYYQGIFLDLVHQLKDKFLKFIELTSSEEPIEPSDKLKPSKLVAKYGERLRQIGIEDLINVWSDEGNEPVSIALKKRTFHHHFVSPLTYDDDYTKLQFYITLSQPGMNEGLSEYGKTQITTDGVDAIQKFKQGVIDKMTKTLQVMNQNIESVASLIVQNTGLNISSEVVEEIMDLMKQNDLSLKIVNTAKIENIPEPIKSSIINLPKVALQGQDDLVEAIYVSGDLLHPDSSGFLYPLRLYIIAKDNIELKPIVSPELETMGIIFQNFTKNHFLNQENKLQRFYCWSDGVLLFGNNILPEEVYPKPGIELAWLINKNILNDLDIEHSWLIDERVKTPEEITQRARILAKKILSFLYGIVITNSPQYNPSGKGQIDAINRDFPQNKKMVDSIIGVINPGINDIESYKNLIIGIRPIVEESYNKIKNIIDQTESSMEDAGGIQ